MVTVKSREKLVLQAAMTEIEGSVVQVNAAMLQCSGIVKADTLEATNVAASNYTPGQGICVVSGRPQILIPPYQNWAITHPDQA